MTTKDMTIAALGAQMKRAAAQIAELLTKNRQLEEYIKTMERIAKSNR